LLGVMGFLETALVVDEYQAPKLARLLPKMARIYKTVIGSQSP
jgi:hypothetical protein